MPITSQDLSPGFLAELMAVPGGELIQGCYACGACSGICPVSQAIPEFDPRKMIHMVRMGLKERLLTSDLLWYCSRCRGCVFVCPQDVRFADIVVALRQLAVEQGYLTEADLIAKGKAAEVARDRCVACLTCVRICPWRVPRIDEAGVATIPVAECRACGICVAECPVQAIQLATAPDERLLAACGSRS
ncbi:MAG: 4Fe-4S dicluster domain-containing protein [Thermodesulfobacteriota bacterium]